jgi:UDP-N-acetylmuramoyl-L-alanyl-D-glutamate--2,6-diaminopimelate ligase
MIRPVADFSIALSDVAELIGAKVDTESKIIVTGITQKDSNVEAGDIFLAIPGIKVHGANFIEAAKERGAVAIVTDAKGAEKSHGLPTLVVADVRSAGALIASSLYASPTRDLASIAITGTNTVVIDTEKLILGNGDAVYANASANLSVGSTVSYIGI